MRQFNPRILAATLLVAAAGCAELPPLERARGKRMGWGGALECYALHLKQHPEDADVRLERANVILDLMHIDFTLMATVYEDITAWIKANPDDPMGDWHLSRYYYRFNDPYKEAEAIGRYYLRLKTKLGFRATAFACFSKKDWKGAVEAINAYYGQEKGRNWDSEGHFWRGMAHLRMDNIAAALEDLEEWWKVGDKDWHRRSVIVEARFKAGEYRSRQDADEVLEKWGHHPVRFLRARMHFEDKHYDTCRKLLGIHLGYHPDDGDAFNLRAAAWIVDKNMLEANQDLTRALKLDPRDKYALSVRAWTRIQLGALEGALQDQLRYVDAYPDDVDGYYRLAKIYLDLKKWDEAADAVAKACERGSKDPDVYFIRATAFERKGEWAKAADDYGRCLEFRPDANAFLLRARCRFELGRFSESIVDCRDALKLVPDWGHSQALLGLCHASLGDPDAAVKELKIAFRRPGTDLVSFLKAYLKKGGKAFKPIEDWLPPYETSVSRLWKADGLYHAGNSKEALSEVKEILRSTPDITQAYLLRGMILESLGRHEEALGDVERYGKEFGDCPRYHRSRGICLTKLKRLDEAEKALERSLELNREDAHTWNALGVCNLQQRVYEQAMVRFWSAMHFDPKNGAFIKNYIAAAEMAGKYESAASGYGKWCVLFPDDYVASLNAAVNYQRAGKFDVALIYFERAHKVTTGATEKEYAGPYYFNRAVCEIQVKKLREAREHYEKALAYNPKYPKLDFTDYDQQRRDEEWYRRQGEEREERIAAFVRESNESNAGASYFSWPDVSAPRNAAWDAAVQANSDRGAYLQSRIDERLKGWSSSLSAPPGWR